MVRKKEEGVKERGKGGGSKVGRKGVGGMDEGGEKNGERRRKGGNMREK